MRSEQEIFDDLADLCVSPGYSHAIAYFCFRDQVVGYGGTLKGEDYAKLFSLDRLIRTEISTLIGLMVRAPRDLSMPNPVSLDDYVKKTESLLKELHEALNEPAKTELRKALADSGAVQNFNPFANAAALREPIFYGSESAYSFQYRDFSVEKYANDEDWLKKHKNFTPIEAKVTIAAIGHFLNDKLLSTLQAMRSIPPAEWSVLPGFEFTIADISLKSGLSESTTKSVVDAFTFSDDGNPTFTSLNEFNAINGFPILAIGDNSYVLFLYVGLTEALYETPFFWMNGDKDYARIAMKNRGAFTEEFCAARLQRVFGPDNVFQNVDVWENSSRKKKLGEIDVLVLFGDRAIVVQAKSKKLTLAARKGNDLQLQADFKAAVQDACNQAVECSKYLLSEGHFLTDIFGNKLTIPRKLNRIHPICAVSDHYPALSFQSQQFLSFKPIDHIENPLVCDVFFIDVVTEFLETPLRFLSYLELRARAANDIVLSHEIVALGYHLRQNLWLGDSNLMVLGDDLSIDVDIAMAARRDGVEGERNPQGILTVLKGTAVGRLIDEIERKSDAAAIGVGLELLKLSGKSAVDLSRMIDKITAETAKDGAPHDATMVVGREGVGFTVHCNVLPEVVAWPKLQRHCELRKYSAKSDSWFGLSLAPDSGSIRFGMMLEYPWKQNDKLDAVASSMAPPRPIEDIRRILKGVNETKLGRNKPCPCGSGLKYKKCHLR